MAIQLSTETSNLYPNTKSMYILHEIIKQIDNIYYASDVGTWVKLEEYLNNLQKAIANNVELAKPINETLQQLDKRREAIWALHNSYLELEKYIENFKQKYETSKNENYVYQNQKYTEFAKELQNIVITDVNRIMAIITEGHTKYTKEISDSESDSDITDIEKSNNAEIQEIKNQLEHLYSADENKNSTDWLWKACLGEIEKS